MKRKGIILAIFIWTALLLTGCSMRTVEQMYTPPKRSEEFKELQSAIDTAMYGLTFSSPQSGENQQTVQMADLDGDGVDEFLVFAKGASEKPLQVLIFKQAEDGSVSTMDTIGSNGLAFEQVEYVEFDDKPGYELIVGIQVGNQVVRSVAVYTFVNGDAQLLLLNSYSKFLTCDMDEDGRKELMVFRPGEGETERGMAVLYGVKDGQIERSVETELSKPPQEIRRIQYGRLSDGKAAVFVSSIAGENKLVTDIFTIRDGRFANISFSSEAETSIRTLRNYYVYPEDIDNDSVMELPCLITMKPVSSWRDEEQKFLLRWFSIDDMGWETDKMYTFHNYLGGWYMRLNSVWASRVTVDQGEGTYTFYVWDESYETALELFTIYVFKGSTRDEDTTIDGRVALYRTEGVAYAGKLAEGASDYDITVQYLIDSFSLIRQDWRTGET